MGVRFDTPAPENPAPRRPLGQALRALSYRNYRLFFFGQGFSLMGTWTQRVAMSWLVYRMTDSELWLGIVGFSSMIPAFFLAPVAGVLADRFDKRRLLIGTQAVAMAQALVLAFLTLAQIITVPQIVALSLVLGVATAFDVPIRQSFQIEMVDRREDLPNAIALNSFLFNGSKLLGPAAAGLLISAVGEGWCFLINGLTFVGVLLALIIIRVPQRISPARHTHPLQVFREGFVYAYGFAPIRSILIQLSLASLLGMGVMVLMPIFAGDILNGDSRTLGFLMSASGLGAVVGTIYLASRRSPQGLGLVIATGGVLYGLATIIFGISGMLWLSIGVMALSGFGQMIQMVSSNTLLQTLVDDDKRGRIMSMYAMSLMGIAPMGSLLAGWLGHQLGASAALLILGAGCVAIGLLFASWLPKLGPMVHPIYVQRGLVPDPETQSEPRTALAAGQKFRM